MVNSVIIALQVCLYLSSIYLIYSSTISVNIIRKWDISSGSEYQLKLEKKTYLIQTIVFWIMLISFINFFLFIYEIDNLCNLITGAMCAFGTLSSNFFGWFSFFLKIFSLIFSSVWLIINKIDNNFENYPLIKIKYRFLIFVTVFFVADSIISTLFFMNIKPNIIVSCCGSFFEEVNEVKDEFISKMILDKKISLAFFVFYQFLSYLVIIWLLKKQYFHIVVSFINLINVFIIYFFFIFFITPYIYELPNHYCFFCMLKSEYKGLGYLYYFLFLIYAILSFILTLFTFIDKKFQFLEKYKYKYSYFILIVLAIIIILFIFTVFKSNLKLVY